MQEQSPNAVIYTADQPITLNSTNGPVQVTEKARFDVYIKDIINGHGRMAHFVVEAWVMSSLAPGLLLGLEFMDKYGIDISTTTSEILVARCRNLVIPCKFKSQGSKVAATVRTTAATTIPPRSYDRIPVRYPSLPELNNL